MSLRDLLTLGLGPTVETGASADWTDGEKEQIRKALGITGATAATSGTGNLDAVLTAVGDLSTDEEIGAAVLVAMNAAPPAVNVTLWKDATAPAMTGDAFARLGAPAGASVSADIAAIEGGGIDLTTVLEETMTFGEALRIMLAALAGKTDGSGTPALSFYGQDGTTVRISATVDGIGNRTAVTLDGIEA